MSVRKNLNHLATTKDARLQIGVTHARAFSKSDWFLEDYGGKKSTKFISLYTEFSKRADPDPDCKEIIKLIDDQEFMNVQSELDRLKVATNWIFRMLLLLVLTLINYFNFNHHIVYFSWNDVD